MTPAIKAMLLSSLVFPGLGQLNLGQKKRGWIIIITTLASLLTFIYLVAQKAKLILAELQENYQVLDMQAISKVAAESSSFSDNTVLNSLLIILLVCWIFGTVDAYLLARKTKS